MTTTNHWWNIQADSSCKTISHFSKWSSLIHNWLSNRKIITSAAGERRIFDLIIAYSGTKTTREKETSRRVHNICLLYHFSIPFISNPSKSVSVMWDGYYPIIQTEEGNPNPSLWRNILIHKAVGRPVDHEIHWRLVAQLIRSSDGARHLGGKANRFYTNADEQTASCFVSRVWFGIRLSHL